ncbi:MAG: NADP-dependent oxidoreductase [Thalassobaculales bacterium]
MTAINRRWHLAARPVGAPKLSDFRLDSLPIPSPQHGEVLVKGLYLSLDPYMRGRMAGGKSYTRTLEVGDPMVGAVVGEVMESRHPALKPGDIVEGPLGWQEYGVLAGHELRRIDPSLAPISTALGVLGMPGMTAYFGLLEVGRPRPGDTVVVSSAAGAVGSLVAQIARIAGARVVGIAGGAAKCAYVREIGADAAIDYRDPGFAEALAAACPAGVDVYFDNVGGTVSEAVLQHLALRARIVICGSIALYNSTTPHLGPSVSRPLLVNRARMEGFLVFDWRDRYPEGIARIAAWIAEGRITYREDVVEGIEQAPAAMIGLLEGRNFGKMLVKLA